MAGRKPRSPGRPRRVSESSPPAVRRLLLDTHVWLWWQADSARLGKSARRAIAGAGEVYFSAASGWEIAIKVALGKLTLPPGADIVAELGRNDFRALPVDFLHGASLRALPKIHRDPFDRMLIAQAAAEGLTLVTSD